MPSNPTCSAAKPGGPSEVAEVLAITFEREILDGTHWCLPRDAATVKRWIVDQGRELGGALRRLVRLASLLAHAEERGVAEFLYVRIRTLRANEFRAALEACRKTGRLKGLAFELSAKGAIIGDQGRGFEIDYLQMPRIGALLDILHNALGYATVTDILAPITERDAGGSFDDVARNLDRAFGAWLKTRLETRHHLRQAQAMRAFLAAGGSVTPDAITNETILKFWQDGATSREPGAVDGFRLYVNAARAMLGYRQALGDAMIEAGLQAADEFSEGDHESHVAGEEGSEVDWISPLTALLHGAPPKVKWLTRKERHALANYLGSPSAAGEADSAAEPDARLPWSAGLAGDRPFELRFCRTLLRADVFGPAQASIVARRQKNHPDSVAHAMGSIAREAYAEATAVYADIGAQLRLEALAALHILTSSAAVEAMILVSALGGPEAVHAIRVLAGPVAPGPTDDEVLSGLDKALARASADPGRLEAGDARALFEAARASLRKVHRTGFGIPASPETVSALKAAAAALPELLAEIQRLRRALDGSPWIADALEDKVAFGRVFADMYGENADACD